MFVGKKFAVLFCLLAAAAAASARAEQPGRVILLSLDAMGWQALKEDPATKPLTALRELMKKGAHAAGVTPHFPSTTGNSHAALWNGAWGDVSGITGNNTPMFPRSEHTFSERISGFDSTELRSEPLWLAAARQGVRTVTIHASQSFPFTPQATGGDPSLPLTMLTGYQTHQVSPQLYLHRKDVKDEACPASAPKSRRKPICVTWKAGPLEMHAVLYARSAVYDTAAISADGHTVEARYAPTETAPPLHRALGRLMSAGLYLPHATEASPAVVYFRLFEMAPDASDFFLYETPIRDLAIYRNGKNSRETVEQLMQEEGGFVALSQNNPLTDPPLEWGTPVWKGGDGTAERRYLEAAELNARQELRYAVWLWKHEQPRLMMGYFPFPDEFEHSMKGVGKDPRYVELRAWGYVMVNRAVETLARLRGPNDHVVFVSDHGITAIDHYVRINYTLQQAGLQTVDDQGKIDVAHTQAMHNTNCVMINTTDWKGGIVPPAEKAAVIAKAEAALRAVTDEENGLHPITRFFDTPEDMAKYGYGGPNGNDFCFDYAPGYSSYDTKAATTVFRPVPPRGIHGLAPDRADMQAIVVGYGPRFRAGTEWKGLHSIDVAPLVAQLLGIRPPKNAAGHSPL